MSQPAKFTFDLDFAKTTSKSKLMEQEDIDLLISQAREQGYQDGLAAGQTSIESQTSQQIAAAAEQVAGLGTNFLQKLDQAQAHHLVLATDLAASIGKKLATHLVDKFPIDEIEALLADCVSTLGKSAHLVVRCNDALSDNIKPIAEQYAHQSGYTGRLIIMGEPDIALGDVRIEWSDGGLARNMAELTKEIELKVAAYINHKAPTEAPIEPIDDAAPQDDDFDAAPIATSPEEVE
jgi:flagellar assembly protein FliH